MDDIKLSYSNDAKVIDPETGKPMLKVFVAGGSTGGSGGETTGQATAEKQDEIVSAIETNTSEIKESFKPIYDGVQILTQDTAKIFGVYWDKTSSPKMTRIDDSKDLSPVIGVDGAYIENPFDKLPIYRDIVDVKDDLGNEFVQIPKFYIQEKMGKGFYQLRISQTKHPGFYLPAVFWDHVNQRELPYYWHGKYAGWADTDNILRSIKGVIPRMGHSIGFYRGGATQNNANGRLGYQLMDIHAVNVIQALFLVEHATLDSQSVIYGFGMGVHSASATPITVGETGVNRVILANADADKYVTGQSLVHKGTYIGDITSIEVYDTDNKALNFSGAAITTVAGEYTWNFPYKTGFSENILPTNGSLVSNTDGKHPFAYRGIESPWSDCDEFVDGVMLSSFQAYVSSNPADYGDIAKYQKLAYKGPTGGGLIKEMGFDSNYPFAKLPIALGASQSTYYCDNYLSGAGVRVPVYGGGWAGLGSNGLFNWSFTFMVTGTGGNVSGRLIKKAL
jgi:hypothetical protein